MMIYIMQIMIFDQMPLHQQFNNIIIYFFYLLIHFYFFFLERDFSGTRFFWNEIFIIIHNLNTLQFFKECFIADKVFNFIYFF